MTMENKDEKLIEKELSSQKIYDGRLLHVYKDKVILPNGKTSYREYLKHRGAAAIVPLTENNDVIAVRQYRYPLRRVTIEIPAGKIDEGEEPVDAALRELSEEAGITSAKLKYIGGLLPSVAYTDEEIHMYIATDLVFGTPHADEDEFLEIIKIPLSEFVNKILDGEIKDSKTQAAILKTALLLKKS